MFPFSLTSPGGEFLLAIVHIVLAVSVTIDVLLKKSDVRAALGWIGLVWLAPIFGSVLYFLFGINRVTRRALRLGRLDSAQIPPPQSAAPDAAAHIALLSQVSQQIS